jgi:hypothetical protein
MMATIPSEGKLTTALRNWSALLPDSHLVLTVFVSSHGAFRKLVSKEVIPE